MLPWQEMNAENVCHQKGHWAKNCPKKTWETRNKRGNWKPNYYSSGRNTNAIEGNEEDFPDDSQEENPKN